MLTSKQRAFLRSMANTMEPILMVGKGGLGANLNAQADQALAARELVKGRVLPAAGREAKEAATELAAAVGAEVVQVVGRNFVIYRQASEPKVLLP